MAKKKRSKQAKITCYELTEFIIRYQQKPNDKEFEEYFLRIKPYLGLRTYKDPHGILELSDFEAIAMYGFWKSIHQYDPTKWDQSIAWVYYIVRQRILLELKKANRYSKDTINSHNCPDLDMDTLEDILVEKEVPFEILHVEEVNKLIFSIASINKKASMTFQLKLAFPDISRTSIARILGFKRRNGVAKLVRIIRSLATNNFSPELRASLYDDD